MFSRENKVISSNAMIANDTGRKLIIDGGAKLRHKVIRQYL